MERGVFLEMRNYVTSLFLNFKKFPQPVGETALQPTAFVATKPWRTPRFGEVKRNSHPQRRLRTIPREKGRSKMGRWNYGVLTTRKPTK